MKYVVCSVAFMLCCIVLHFDLCIVLHCVLLCCTLLCRAVLCYTALRCAVSLHAAIYQIKLICQ